MFLSAYRAGRNFDINVPVFAGMSDCPQYFYQSVSPKPLAELTQPEMLCLRPAALLHMVEINGGEDQIIKTHFPCGDMGGINPILPSLTRAAVYLVRDPRDVAVSYSAHSDCPVDEIIGWMSNMEYMVSNPGSSVWQPLLTWSAHVQSWAEAAQRGAFPVLALKYEQLLADPEKAFRLIIDAVGWEFSEPRFTDALAATTIGALQAQEKDHGFREQVGSQPFFRSGRAGGWRDVLTAEQVGRIEADHGDAMRLLGYELEGAVLAA